MRQRYDTTKDNPAVDETGDSLAVDRPRRAERGGKSVRVLRSAECRAEFSVLVTNWTVETTRAARFDLFLAQTHTRLAKVP